jgi:NADH:ubiquinone oxidoreductase subunit 3 (subunit A)
MRNKKNSTQTNSVFVSYRSTDVNVVRSIVDILRYNGIDVWFAEYCILLDTWLENDYEKIISLISIGIKNCDHFIAFSSSGWYASKYTSEDEFQSAKSKFSGSIADNITNIVLEKSNLEYRNDPLSDIPQFVHKTTNLRATLDFLEERIGRKLIYKSPPDIQKRELVIFNGKYSAKVNCWPLSPRDLSVMKSLQGIVFNYLLGVNFYFLPKRVQGQLRGLSQTQLTSKLVKDDTSTIYSHDEDRRLYYDCAKRASTASTVSNIDVVGLHLVSIPVEKVRTGQKNDKPGIFGENAFSITKCGASPENRGHNVARDYSFQLWNGYNKPIGELWISASILFQGMDAKSAIKTFSGFSQYIDNIALSTAYEGTTNKTGLLQYACRSSIYLVILMLIAADVISHFPLLTSMVYQFLIWVSLVGILHVAWKALRYFFRKRAFLSSITYRCYEIDENGAKSKIDVKRIWFSKILIPAGFLSLFGSILYCGFNLKITPVLCLITVVTMVFSRWTSIFKDFWFNHHYGSAVKSVNLRNFADAERKFKKSLLQARSFDVIDNRKASVLYNLAGLAEAQGKLDEAIKLNIESMKIYQQSNGPWVDRTEYINKRLNRLRKGGNGFAS